MRMTIAEIEAAIRSFEASTKSISPTYRRRRTKRVDVRTVDWPAVSVMDQILAFLTK